MTETLSPLEKIKAVQEELKALKAGYNKALEADARENFEPLHEQMVSAIAAIADTENPERAAHALRWFSDNQGEYRKLARVYQKVVMGVAAVRKPSATASDTAAA